MSDCLCENKRDYLERLKPFCRSFFKLNIFKFAN